jgi:hypothetical protein
MANDHRAIAVEESILAEDDGLLGRFMLALGTLTGPVDLEQTGPTHAQECHQPVGSHASRELRNVKSREDVSRAKTEAR